jgi:beta-glucosidase
VNMYEHMHGRQSKHGHAISSAPPHGHLRSLGLHPIGVAAWLLISAVIGTAGAASPVPQSASGGAAEAGSTVHPERWPEVQWPLKTDPAIEDRIRALLAAMTLEEKVAQTVQADIGSITPDEMRQYHLGSILAGGNSAPGGKQYADAKSWLALADDFHRASTDRSNGGQGIPALFGIDAVHGHNNVIGATLYPHNIGLGAMRNPELVGQIAAATAKELRATGIDWTFAPTLAVPRDDRWGRSYEGFSEDPNIIASYAGPIIEGYQGKPGHRGFLGSDKVMATAKHFLGDGGTADGRDQGDARISEAELRDIHGAGYPPAIASGAQAVMASFSGWNGAKMHGNRGLLEDVLRGRMHFNGFVVGDWNGHGQLPGCTNEHCAAAFNAGVDMLMTPESWRGYYTNTLEDVRAGRITMARLDEAVARILRVKFLVGLFDAGLPSQRPLGKRDDLIGHPQHRALARQAVRESLVLLKNSGGLLPLRPQSHVLVAGDGADSVAKQSGGWTLNWQGTGLKPEDFPGATSIWAGLREQIEAGGGTATLSANGRYAQKPDVAIVVFGEEPYAEFLGDVQTLAYKPGDDADLALIQRLKADGIPVVSVFLSGRPLWVNREINASDAFVAAWLPGSEGAGIADVLLRKPDGRVAHDLKGRLSFSWPRSAIQTPLNIGDTGYDPQFPFGFGLRYADAGDLAALSENSGITGGLVPHGLYLARGAATTGSTLSLIGAGGIATRVVGSVTSSDDGSIALRSIDHQAQEDARLIEWRGGNPAAIELRLRDSQNLEPELKKDMLLVMTLQLRAAPTAPVWLSIGCGDGCESRIRIDTGLNALPLQEWLRIGVPLKCLQTSGADMQRIDRPLRIDTAGQLALGLSRVELSNNPDRTLQCDAK